MKIGAYMGTTGILRYQSHILCLVLIMALFPAAGESHSETDRAVYGPVKPKETLSEIAQKVRTDRRIPLRVVMDALQAANPQAFLSAEPDSLTIGAVLVIPDIEGLLTSPGSRKNLAQGDLTDVPIPNVERLSLSGSNINELVNAVGILSEKISAQARIIELLAKRGEANQEQIKSFNENLSQYQYKANLLESQLGYLEKGQAEFRDLLTSGNNRIDRMHALLSQNSAGHGASVFEQSVTIISLILLMFVFGAVVWLLINGRRYMGSIAASLSPVMQQGTVTGADNGGGSIAADPAVIQPDIIEDTAGLAIATGKRDFSHGMDEVTLAKRMRWLKILCKVEEADRFRDEVINMLAEAPLKEMPEWPVICEMGQRLMPGDSLFSDTQAQPGTQGATVEHKNKTGAAKEGLPRPSKACDGRDSAAGGFDKEETIASRPLPDVQKIVDDVLSSQTRPSEGGVEEDSDMTPAVHKAIMSASDRFKSLLDDETGTKMELAKVYLELGSHDNARELLQEVIDEGDGPYSARASQLYRNTFDNA